MPQGGDGDGDGDEDGDEVQEQAPVPSGRKTPSGKNQWSAARQPVPPGLRKSLNKVVGQTKQFF